MNSKIIKLRNGGFRVETTSEVDKLNSDFLYQKGKNNYIESRKLASRLNREP